MSDLPIVRSVHRALRSSMPPSIYRAARWTWRRVRPWLPMGAFQRTYPGLPGPVHDEDHMLRDATADAVAHYRAVGLEACERIGQALGQAGRTWDSVATLLDYGSGHARVLRWITTRHPHMDVTAADVNRQAVRFCRSAFGVGAMTVPTDVERLRLDANWDVIWSGSVLTHLSEHDGITLVRKLGAALRPGGVLLFTTHGELIPLRLDEYGEHVRRVADGIRTAFAEDRVFFVAASPLEGPVTFHSRGSVERMIRQNRLRLIGHWPRGWDDHQDVWAVASG